MEDVSARFRTRPFILTSLIIASGISLSCRNHEPDVGDAMLQMRRIVALLHVNVRTLQNASGFPKPNYGENGDPNGCSWRVAIVASSMSGPYLDQSWQSPLNQPQDTESHRRFFSVISRQRPSEFTQVFALVGPGTAYTEFSLGADRDTSDAEPDAILLIDSRNRFIPWMEPGDIDVGPLLRSSLTSGFDDLVPNFPRGFLVAFVDGAVWWIDKDVPRDVISPFYTLDGAKSHNREVDLAPYVIEKVAPLEKHDGKYCLDPEK